MDAQNAFDSTVSKSLCLCFFLLSNLNDRISTRLFLSPSSASACITTCFDLSISATAIGQHQPTQGWDLILGVSRATQTTEVDDEVSWAQNTCSYSYRELRMATDNFNPANKVGEGGFGSVYKVWEFYQKQELVNLVDTSLAGDYDVEEACNYLKIGLLCIQDVPKQRPSMSTVVMMLMGEIEVTDKISRPGLLSELKSFEGDEMPKHKGGKDQINKREMKNSSSTSGMVGSSSSSLGVDASYATMTFSSIYDRDN
uniref:Putative serine/threonine-protein kinase isoform X2 n=1 Tax=Populus alba TaxID=43335 RepID=A0A4U5NSP2_POPAL|nr:putative serine/threonine-protein kinase isoform X2 [Populus alba]